MVFCLKIVLAGSHVDLLVARRGVVNAIFGAQAQNGINIVYGEVHRPLLQVTPFWPSLRGHGLSMCTTA